MRPAGTPQLAPEPADGIPGKLVKPAKVLTKVSSPGSLPRGLVERKVQFHAVPSFPNPDGQENTVVRMRSLNCDS